MRQLGRWTQTVALATGLALTTSLGAIAPAMALTEEQIAYKLKSVPVFTLINANLKQFAAFSQEGQTTPLVPNYVDRSDAEKLLKEHVETNGALAKDVKILTIPMSVAYMESRSTERQASGPKFKILPDMQEVQAALEVHRETAGEELKGWRGVPLFFVKDMAITLTNDKGETRDIVPMYFSHADLESALDEAKSQDPNLKPADIPISVTTLDIVLDQLSKDNPDMEKIEFVPPKSSIEYMIRIQRQAQPAAN